LSVNKDPTIRSLLKQREQLRRRLQNATKHPKFVALNREINNARQRQRYALLQEIKERWEYEQPVRDVERQIEGTEAKEEAGTLPELYDAMLPVHKELVDAVQAQPGTTFQGEVRRRNRAIHAVIEYCGIEEGRMYPLQPKRLSRCITAPDKSEEDFQLDANKETLEAAKVLVYKDKRPTICFLCLGKENLPLEDRVHSFSSPSDLTKHFKRKHLAHLNEEDCSGCDLCEVGLTNKMHLQRHAYDVHGTVS
jgi:hypothetical protein